MGCILAELYSGEMFFGTHENVEHLAMIEKACGPIPLWMASNAMDEFKDCFDLKLSQDKVIKRGNLLKWPQACKRKESI